MERNLITALGSEARCGELMARTLPSGWDWLHVDEVDGLDAETLLRSRGVFALRKSLFAALPAEVAQAGIPVFVDAVCETTASLPGHRGIIRVNGWPGFLDKPLLELAAPADRRPAAESLLEELGWSYRWVADEPGLVTARVIVTIVNEACMAVREGVSGREEIDTAMRLGAAYPAGPFEWASRIGPERIHRLLSILSEKDPIYTPCPDMLDILSQKT